MKGTRWITAFVLVILVPATVLLGAKLPGKSYYLTGTLLILELMLPFFLAFEGRKPQARELALLAVMCALAIVGRVAIPMPHFKAVFAIIMLTGIAFGPEAGFMVGAVTALASNFFYGQGPYTPWQMMAYGAGGMVAGVLFRFLPRKTWLMATVGFVTVVVLVGPLMDCSNVFLMFGNPTWKTLLMALSTGVPVNISQAVCTALVMVAFGRPLLDRLKRVQIKYGIGKQ